MHTFPLLALSGTFSSAYEQSDFFGKLIILGLFFLSILCWILLIYKIWLTKNVEKLSTSFFTAYQKNKENLLQLEAKDLPHPKHRQIPHPYFDIFHALKSKTLEVLNKNLYFSQQNKGQVYLSPADLEIIESYSLTAVSAQTKVLEKNLFILSTIVTLAPFLGLLGTVWGILVTFAELQTGAAAGSNSAVLGGLSTALVTTVLGLVIAIPALVAYNYLKTTIKNYSSDMEDFLYDLLSTIELQYRKADIG